MRLHFHENDDLKSLSNPNNNNNNTQSIYFHIIQYDDLHFTEHKLTSLIEFQRLLKTISYTSTDHCTWINIEGIHRDNILDEISDEFKLHKLIKEDITTKTERMKFDLLDNGSAIYLLMKMIYIHPNVNHILSEQISFILKENNFLLTFQEEKNLAYYPYDIFQIVKSRLKNNRGRIRSLKIDYLFYCLLDVLIENYMIVLDKISITIDKIDRLLINKFKQNENVKLSSNQFNIETLKLIYHIKHDMLSLKILCQPLREIIIKLQKAQDRISMANQTIHSRRQYRRKKRPKHINLSANYFINPNFDSTDRDWFIGHTEEKAPLFNEYIFLYFKDLNDHILQLQDRIDTYCDVLSSLTAFYMILSNAEMNRLMTFLTLITVIFIPMTFIVALFSMNFQNMPPLVWRGGYFVVLGAVGICAIVMIALFKLKKWL